MAPKDPGGRVLELPVQVISPADVHRLSRELESLEDFLAQSAIRDPGSRMKLPSSTKLLDELAAANSFNFLRDGDRQKARTFLESLSKYAPVVHISFASDPSANFMSKLTTRLRATIHPQLLITVGLEPNIAAGCILRTPNRQFDLSLRRTLVGHENSLINLLKAQAGVNAA